MSSPSQSQACHNHQNYNFRVYLLRPKQFFLGKKNNVSRCHGNQEPTSAGTVWVLSAVWVGRETRPFIIFEIMYIWAVGSPQEIELTWVYRNWKFGRPWVSFTPWVLKHLQREGSNFYIMELLPFLMKRIWEIVSESSMLHFQRKHWRTGLGKTINVSLS